ncbi:MAG: hypothetical protein ACOCUZ_01425, partial [bacterium]
LEDVVELLAVALPDVFGDRSKTSAATGEVDDDGRCEDRFDGEVEGGPRPPRIPAGLSGGAARIWAALGNGSMTVDELAGAVELGSGRVLALLSSLEADGWAEARPGMRYARRDPGRSPAVNCPAPASKRGADAGT